MNKSQSWKDIAPEGEKVADLGRTSSQPPHTPQATTNEHSFAAVNSSSKSSMDEMRRRIVQLNKELEQERTLVKNLRRDKVLEVRQARDEEQRKAIAMQTELRSKLHKEKVNELTALKEQVRKEKEKEILLIIRQKDEILRTAQQAWAKEKDELKSKIRNELRGETREDSKREFEKERCRMEQEIADLYRQKRDLEETLKLVQDADKRKIEDIRRIHHEHEAELDKFKRNSWQESRQQMAEIRQLLNIIEQLEKKLGLEAGHSMRLRLEKDNLNDLLKKSTTFDTWDRMMSSGKSEQATPPGTPDSKGSSQEFRMLQRKNVELSSLVRKLDEKNQQLATRNAELLAELEKLEKDNREKNRKLERKNTDLAQTNKRLESRNKLLLDEVNSWKKTLTKKKENTVKRRGPANKEDELGELKAQVREQTRTIADLKQSMMEKDRRIELLRGRKKKSKQQPVSLMSQPTDLFPVADDDALSVHSDFSEASEMSSSEDVDSKRIKKLAKELLALERAYALLQAQVSSAVDVERDEMAKQQLQSDLLESQTRIHELERMIDSGQGSGLQEISNLQEDNKALYQKLVAAEQARDKAQSELDKYSEDMRELQDQRDLLEFELEEMSQLSTAGSEDWDSRKSRNGLESFSSPRMLSNDAAVLTLEDIKALLEELGSEKEDVLSPVQKSALKQARIMLESMDEKIHHMEITEMALRDKVRDLDLGYNSESLKSDLDETRSLSLLTCDRETLADLQWTKVDNIELYQEQRMEAMKYLKKARVVTEDTCCMTDLTGDDLVSLENIGRNYPHDFPDRGETSGKSDKDCMTDLAWWELGEMEETYVRSFAHGKCKGEVETVDNETDINCQDLEELESKEQETTAGRSSREDSDTVAEIIWEELDQQENEKSNSSLPRGVSESNMDMGSHGHEVGIVTDLSLAELALMEIKYLECIENLHEVKSGVVTEKDEMTGFSSVEWVETLPEIVLDTFPEDLACTKDQCEMTELKCDDIAKLSNKCIDYKHSLEELEKRIALFDVEKKEESCSPEFTWSDIDSLQEKCYSYKCIISELEDKISLFEVEKKDKSSSTELSLQDLVNARFSVDTKEVETITDEKDFLDNEDLPEIVFETYPGAETKGECDTTHGVWEEVVDLKNTYRDYRENLEDMKNKLAQFQVEKDDKESITDIAMQDLADLESLYKEHLHDVDSDSNSILSHAEKESRQCMTELTFVELSELEDFYIENAARQEESLPMVEKWEQESMTDITHDVLQYLEEVEELYRQKTRAGADEEVRKEEKYTATDLTVSILDHLLEGANGLLEFSTEKMDKMISTDVTIPVLEPLHQTEKLHQRYPKVDKCVATELTSDDIEYWGQEEKLHRERLNGREENKTIADMGIEQRYDVEISSLRGKSEELENEKNSVERLTVETMTYLTVSDLKCYENVDAVNDVCFAEKHSVETMTDFTLSDLKYLEAVKGPRNECTPDRNAEQQANRYGAKSVHSLTASDPQLLEGVEASHKVCLVDGEDKLYFRIGDKESVRVMTDFTASDLKYLKDVEAAHEACLVLKQEELDARIVDKESVEVMTDLTASDLNYLENVEAAHEACLVLKQEELDARIVDKESVEVMTDLTASDLNYLENVEAAHEECLADKHEELDIRTVDKESVEVMTDLTASDLNYLEDVEAAHEECLADKHEELDIKTVDKESVEIMTDLTSSDLNYLEDVEAAHEECLADKHEELDVRIVDKESVEVMTDLTASDLNYLEDIKAAQEEYLADKHEELDIRIVDKESVEVMTDLTSSDLNYSEDVEAAHEECLADKQEDLDIRTVDKESVEVMTDLTASDLNYLEDVKAAQEESLADKHEELDIRTVDKESVEVMTDLTSSDLNYLEDVEAAHEECLADKQEDLDIRFVDKESVEVMADLTASDLNYLEDVKAANEESLADKHEELDFRIVDKESVEVMTDLTACDLNYLEDVKAAHEEYLANKHEELHVRIVDKESVEVMTDLTASDLNYLEDVKAAQEEYLADKHDGLEAATVKKENANIMTDLSVLDLQRLEDVDSAHMQCLFYIDRKEHRSDPPHTKFQVRGKLESAPTENEESKAPKWRRRSRSTSVSVHMQNKHTMTELTANILEYFEDIEVLYKKTLVEYDDFRKLHSVEKVEKDSMTVITTEDLKYLKDESSIRQETEEKEVMTELAIDDLDYLMGVESSYNNHELDRRSEDMNSERTAEIMTSVTLASIECMEDEYERLQREQPQEKDPSWVRIEQEDSSSELQYLEEVELSCKEDSFGAAELASSEDAGVMTDLTTADLEYLEEAENLLKSINDNGSELSGMLAPKEDKEVMTKLTNSDIDHLHTLGEFHIDGTMALSSDGEVEKDDKGTETELTAADIRDLEDQAGSGSEKRATPSFHEFVHDNFQAETLVNLQSELDYLPVLDEPEFIMDEDEDVDIEENQCRDACVMTELTFSDLQQFGIYNTCDGVGLIHSRREQTDIGVQCTLEDLRSLLEELNKEAEEKGADVPSWFVTALKMRQPGGFNPIHLVVGQTDEIDAPPAVELPNSGVTPKHVPERAQMSNIPIDMAHVSDGLHECFSSNSETNILHSGASFKNIGVQCDPVDVDAMLSEFRGIHPRDVDMPLFVSAINMARQDTGFNPVEVVMKNRSDSNPVQDEVATEPNNSFAVEFSRLPPPPEKATFTISSPPPVQFAEDEQSEFPEADNPLLSSQNGSDSVFNLTDEAINSTQDGEDRDVLTDMPPDSSAVNRFDKFLKERKDSELLNLMAIRQGIDDSDIEDTGDIKSLKELEEENELLRKHLLILESGKGTEDLEEENRNLWEKLKEKTEELEKKGALLKEKVQSLEDREEENALIKEKMKILEELADVKDVEKENDKLREQVKALEEASMISDAEIKNTKEENEELREKIKTLEQTMDTEELQRENDYLKQQVEMLSAEPERVKELEGENETLNEKIEALKASADDVVCENTLLKEQIEDLEQNDKLHKLKDENKMLKDKLQFLEDASTSERLENEQLMDKIQDLEHSTGRVVESLEEENSVLKENIKILEDTTSNMKTLEDENILLRERIESLYSTKAKGLSEEEFETLQKKIEQLKEADKTIAALNESNTALKARIDILQSEKKNDRDVSSDMDPSEQLGKVRLLLVQDFGLTSSEVESVLGSCDLESHVSSGMATPRDQLNNLGHYFEQADGPEQSDVGDTPCSVIKPIQHITRIPGGINEVNSPIPENIAKELENLKQENRRLCEELKELRRTVQDRQNTERLNEETQTDCVESSEDIAVRSLKHSQYVLSSIPGDIEETIAPQVRSTVATEIRYLGDSRLEFEPSTQSRYKKGAVFSGKDDPMDYSALIRDFENTMPSHNESSVDTDDLISEPELMVSQRNLDTQMDIIDQRIQDLRYIEEKDSVPLEEGSRDGPELGDLVTFGSDDEGDLPPLPESSPPPLPSEPPPDFTESPPSVLHGLEVLLNSDSSPPRDAATLRASSRQRLHSENKPTSEVSQSSSRMESPLLVEETTLVLESDPRELGGIYPIEEPTSLTDSSGRRPTSLGSIKPDDSKTKAPLRVLPGPRRLLLPKRELGPLNQPVVSYANSNVTSSMQPQRLRDEEDGIIPPRGFVLNRAALINSGEIDALNEKIGFLERQLKNKENVIRSLKTEATERETQSLLERKDRELRILDEDVVFLKEENQKKEKELLTKIGEINKKNYEIEQWKAEASNSERQRQRMEAAYMNLQNQLKSTHGAEKELAELQTKYSGMEKQNLELSEKVKKLEKSEKEFKKLEHSIQILQAQLQEMDVLEQDRNNLIEKMKAVENQRDDLLRKGRMVETERNDFLRNNKLMEMQRDELKSRCSVLQKTNSTLNTRLAQLEHDVREAQTKMHDSQHERNFLKVQLEKMEAERNEMQTRLALTTQERNLLENQVAELQDLNRDHVKLEDSFHSLRIKLAESTRHKDDAEMQIPTLKAKVSLLRRACKEKDDLVEKLNEEIRDLRHFISTSTLDDLSKIRSFGYAHDNFTKSSTHREQKKQIAKQVPKMFEPSPPGSKKARRFIALFDYDPHSSPSSEHPDLELKLKEGDLLTVFGDMDINGYLEADLNGERGLVPSLYVEEVEDANDSDTAPEEQLTISHRAAGPLKHGALNRSKEIQLYPDVISCRRGSSSSGASSAEPEKRRCLVALYDYDPFCSGVRGWPPHDQLTLKKGDVMTALEDQDANGFYRVFLNGQTGFVPGQMVENESSSLSRQPVNRRAPEQILGMLNNCPRRGQPEASSTQNSDYPTPLPSMGSMKSLTHDGNSNGLQSSLTRTCLPGSPNKLPNVGLTKFKPSPDVDMLGVMTSVTQSSQQLIPLPSQEPDKISTPRATPKQIAPVVSTKSLSKKVRPSAPSNFRCIRPVNHDAMLVGWTLPEMDEFGRSSGLSVKGYKIYANDDVRLDVRSPYMAKALVEGLELGLPIKFSIKTVAENGTSSETVSVAFNDTIKESLLDSREEYFEDLENEQQYRTFVALYDYDPFKSSPNQNPAAEMSFKEGDILKVFNTFRKDGYFVGKLKNRKGLIPSNFIEEVAVASPLRLAAAKRRKAAPPSPTIRPQSGHISSVESIGSPTVGAKNPVLMNRKMMVALYDYNPEVQSPQDNPDSELPLKKGKIFTVFGDMRADGFYQAEVNGELGLVPGSFLDEYTTGGIVSGLQSGMLDPVE